MSGEQRRRNPLRSEADAFRVLVLILAAAGVVIAVAELVSSLAGALVGLAFVLYGAWRVGTWLRAGIGPG